MYYAASLNEKLETKRCPFTKDELGEDGNNFGTCSAPGINMGDPKNKDLNNKDSIYYIEINEIEPYTLPDKENKAAQNS